MPPSHNPARELIHVTLEWPDLPLGARRTIAAHIARGWYIAKVERLTQRRYRCTGRLSNWAGGADRYGAPLTRIVTVRRHARKVI